MIHPMPEQNKFWSKHRGHCDDGVTLPLEPTERLKPGFDTGMNIRPVS